MKCVYCAEEIQDEAIVCRFCGATKDGEEWARGSVSPSASVVPTGQVRSSAEPLAPATPAGQGTIRLAGVFFLMGAVFELIYVTSEVPLFGAMRGGLAAVAYHGMYVALFAAVGFSLWKARPWGLKSVFIMTAIYSLDKIRYLLDTEARTAELSPLLAQAGGVVDEAMIFPIINITSSVTLLCWWGFAAYVYWRRAYFAAE